MTTYEVVAASLALAAISVPFVTWLVLWLIRRDRIFANLPPGEIPANLDEAPTRFVSHGAHYWGEVEARSTPPAGVSVGLAGVVLDGAADGRDIAAMILDLTRRGWVQLKQVGGTYRAAMLGGGERTLASYFCSTVAGGEANTADGWYSIGGMAVERER